MTVLGINAKLLGKISPGARFCSRGDNLIESLPAPGGKQIHHQQFAIAQIDLGLLLDEGVNGDLRLPGNRGGHEAQASHWAHAERIEGIDGVPQT
jgi:hypothetical protein